MYQYHLVDKVVNPDGTIHEEKDEVIENQMDLKEENLAAVYEGMYLVANGSKGTMRTAFKDLPVTVAAKTGTAQGRPVPQLPYLAGLLRTLRRPSDRHHRHDPLCRELRFSQAAKGGIRHHHGISGTGLHTNKHQYGNRIGSVIFSGGEL